MQVNVEHDKLKQSKVQNKKVRQEDTKGIKVPKVEPKQTQRVMPKQRKKAKANKTLTNQARSENIAQFVAQKRGKTIRQKSATSMRVRTPKAKVKGIIKGSNKASVNAVETTMEENVSALQQQVSALSQKLANSQSQASNPAIAAASGKKIHQGGVAPGNPNICFALKESPAKAVELDASQRRSPSNHIAAMKVATKYVMVNSGATTSCANETAFPQATVDPTKVKELSAINCTPIQHQGEMKAATQLTATAACGATKIIPATFRMDITDTTETVMPFCRILDEADCDMHFYRSSSGKTACIHTPDGNVIGLPRFGARFYLPYEDRRDPTTQSEISELIAAVEDA